MDDLENELCSLDGDLHEDSDFIENDSKKRKKPKLPLANVMRGDAVRETGFHRNTRMCLEHIRDAMLHHRWQEAAEYMACYSQILEDTAHNKAPQNKETVWRIGTEILHHHPKSTLADYKNIYERMKQSGIRHYLMICLEQSFHLMLHGHIADAKQQLSAGESWRYGKESAAQHQRIKLVQAYRSLLDYVSWCEKKSTASSSKYFDSDDHHSVHSYFRQASVSLRDILKSPGVWDPFILSYVEMLEFYEAHDEALKMLNDYAYDSSFPPNPNAHVYLYQYLKRHNAPEKNLMKVLKVLYALVPSHELTLEYTSLLLRSEKSNAAHIALEVVLHMLDFACWRRNLGVWEHLQTVIQQLQTKADWQGVVAEKMAPRKDWWPALHFTSSHASQDSGENPELFRVKSSLSEVLLPDCSLKYTTEQKTNGKTPDSTTSGNNKVPMSSGGKRKLLKRRLDE